MRMADRRTKTAKITRVVLAARMPMLLAIAMLASNMILARQAQAGVILTENFEGGFTAWSGQVFTFPGIDYSDSLHSGIPGGGSRYGWSPQQSTSPTAIRNATQTIDLDPGQGSIEFDGWLASYTLDVERTVFRAEFFDAAAGAGSSLGEVVLASGFTPNAAGGVTEYVDSGGALIAGDAGSDQYNWSHYLTSNPIPSGAMSVLISYNSETPFGTSKGNDAYADNIVISTTAAPATAPEPATGVLLMLGGLFLAGRRSRRRTRA